MTQFRAQPGEKYMYKTDKDALDSIRRIKEIMFPTERQRLEAENTEYDYGHNVKHYPE